MTNNWLEQKQMLEQCNMGLACFDDVPDEVINFLKNEDIKKENLQYNEKLAGHIKQEYEYKNWPDFLENYVIQKIESSPILIEESSSYNFLNKNVPFYLQSLWCNYQKKYEFNPFHSHSGVFSFIIFLKIPYDFKKEMNYFPPNSSPYNENSNSKLCFFRLNNFGKILDVNVRVDKSFEGKMFIFPSKLNHLVYPFYTSDDYRITVSGNIKLRV